MSATATALFGLVIVSIVLTFMIAGIRSAALLGGKKAINDFDPGGADVSALSRRVCRAHANCYENLPLSAAVMLYAIATGQTGITDSTAMWFLYARIAQVGIHVTSTSALAVYMRFALYVLQILILICWVYRFLAG